MREPFKVIPRDSNPVDKDGNEILQLRMSRLSGCPEGYWQDLHDPQQITDELNETFDKGNDVHNEKEILNEGAKKNIAIEEVIKIMYDPLVKNEKTVYFIFKGTSDSFEFDFSGRFLRDYKSTYFNGFWYFMKEYDPKTKNLGDAYTKQLSGYAYLIYVKYGVLLTHGVITKVDKENHRNEVSLEGKLYTLPQMRKFLLRHPVLLLYFNRITREKFLELCVQWMQGKEWMCKNCVRNETCEVCKMIRV